MDRAQREAVAAGILADCDADETEAIVYSSDSGLTRFTHNAIHQNVAAGDTVARIRAVFDGRTGVATTNHLGVESLRAAIARAKGLARLAPRDDAHVPMSKAEPPPPALGAWVDATAAATPAVRAKIARAIFDVAERNALWAAGFVTTSAEGTTIANSRGTLASFDGTECALAIKQNGPDSTGYAERYSKDVADLDGAVSGEVAAHKAVESASPATVEPGEWTVILEPAAACELLATLTGHFSAQSYDEGSSFLAGNLGRPLMPENVTIVDDVRHPLHPGMPFDFEGVPTQRVALVENGVGNAVVTDTAWAARLGRANTGHALPAPNAAGPQARHLVIAGGDKTREELIAETKRGLLISRLWYVRTVDYRRTILTGMTRDGTFLVENGRIAGGVRNLRFNQSMLEALQSAQFGRDLARAVGYSCSIVLPVVKFDRFSFTSTTDF